jgi:hypothetical protein
MTNSYPEIQHRIFHLRGKAVLIDRDLAQLYHVETKVLNQAVKRNSERFPEEFCFQLDIIEFKHWKSQIVTSKSIKMGLRRPPFAFTEQGVAMLSSVLRSEIAIRISIQVINAFVAMRQKFYSNSLLISRIHTIEQKQQFTDDKINIIFEKMERQKLPTEKGIFFDGEIFDAYVFIIDLIKKANKEIILIDNYIDETTFIMLSNRDKNVKAKIYTFNISEKLKLTAQKHNAQFDEIKLTTLKSCHDRFIIIDNKELYHIGASLKDLGKKWFAFSKMNDLLPELKKRLVN